MTTKNNDRQKILIVDDEPDITIALKMYLEIQGFQVDAFTDPVYALAQFKAGFYQLLILDIKMPEMNGFELYTEIKNTTITPFSSSQKLKIELSSKQSEQNH